MFLFFIFMNRCGLGGCSGHSSRKKADVADAFKALLLSVAFVLSILQQASPPGGLHLASWGQKKGQGINAPGSSPWPWLMELENKCLGRMYGHSSLSSSVLCLCPWPWLLSWWLFSVKILVPLNTNWVCYARQKYDNQCLLQFNRRCFWASRSVFQGFGFSSLLLFLCSPSFMSGWGLLPGKELMHPWSIAVDGPGAESSVLERGAEWEFFVTIA